MPSSVKKSWVDPLTFREMKVGDRVKLYSDNDITTDLVIEDVYDDDSILLKKPDTVVISAVKKDSLILHESAMFDAKVLKPNDSVQIKLKNGKVFNLRVEYIFNKDFLILGPVDKTKRLNFLNKIKLFWK